MTVRPTRCQYVSVLPEVEDYTSARPTTRLAKFGASATGSCQTLTKNNEALNKKDQQGLLAPIPIDLLQDRPPSKLLAPRCPQFTTKSVHNQEYHLAQPGNLLANLPVLCYLFDGTWEDAGIEVHRYLDREDGRKKRPLLPGRPAVTEFVPAFFFGDDAAPVFGDVGWNATFTPGRFVLFWKSFGVRNVLVIVWQAFLSIHNQTAVLLQYRGKISDRLSLTNNGSRI